MIWPYIRKEKRERSMTLYQIKKKSVGNKADHNYIRKKNEMKSLQKASYVCIVIRDSGYLKH